MKNLIVSIIPARSGSKGVKNKNILEIGGYPLIAYSIAASNLSKNISKTIVTTDSKKIADISKKFGADVPFLRPKKISGDKSTDIEYINHAINWYKLNNKKIPTHWVLLRPTTPFRDPKIIDKAVKKIVDNKIATSLVSVHEFPESPAKMFGMKNSFLHGLSPFDPREEYFTLPRQSFPKTFFGNGYIDIILTKTVLEKKSMYGFNMLGFETDDVGEIDIKEDIEKLNYTIRNKKILLNNYLKNNF